MQSCVLKYIYLRVCNCAYMTGSHQPTYWKEGGRESPMPPVLSRGGGSSGWLSVHWDPPSEWALSARTSWGRENLMWQTVDMFVFEGSRKNYFAKWHRSHCGEREDQKEPLQTLWHWKRQAHLAYGWGKATKWGAARGFEMTASYW